MNGLTVSWAESDSEIIAIEIEKLFRLKGYRMSDKGMQEMAALFARELSLTGKPIKAVLMGIHKLKFEKLNRIDIADIIEASSEAIEPEEIVREKCDECNGLGVILLKDENQYEFSLACVCRNGDQAAGRGYARWNGKETQMIRGKNLELKFKNVVDR